MARPQSGGVDYFPHQCNHGKTLFILEQRFGNDGYALWFKLLELLGKTPGHSLDLTSPPDLQYFLAYVRLDEQTAIAALNICADLDAIDEFLWRQRRTIWSYNFVENLVPVYRKRKSDVPTPPGVSADEIGVSGDGNPGSEGFPVPQGAEMPQSRVEESKVKKSKGEKRKAPPYSFGDVRRAIILKRQLLVLDPNRWAGKRKEPDLLKWASDFRLIREADGRSPAEIDFILANFISHRGSGDFSWAENIASPKSLRGETRGGADKFQKILKDLKKENPNGTRNQAPARGPAATVPQRIADRIRNAPAEQRAALCRKYNIDPALFA